MRHHVSRRRRAGRRWRPTLLLIGTTHTPAGPDELDGLTEPAELKRTDGRLRRGGESIAPPPRAFRQEFARNQRDPPDAGTVAWTWLRGRVRPGRRPVTLPGSPKWSRTGGAVTANPVGLIDGAGLIHDKLIRDKSRGSFDRVLGTKLDGMLNLLCALNPDLLRFTIFFSSIAGRFGNRCQSDYAAANEVLNKLAIWLDRRTRSRVCRARSGPVVGNRDGSDFERTSAGPGNDLPRCWCGGPHERAVARPERRR